MVKNLLFDKSARKKMLRVTRSMQKKKKIRQKYYAKRFVKTTIIRFGDRDV